MIWRLCPGKHPLASAIRPDHDMRFQFMCLAKIRVLRLLYHGLRFKFVLIERGGRLTFVVSCGWAPGCGVQLLDWADPRARTTRPTPGAPTRRTEYRRQGGERPLGVDVSKLIGLACSMWPVRMLTESDAGKRNIAGELSARR